MIPIGTDIQVRKTPWANYALIAANVIVYLLLNVWGRGSEDLTRLREQLTLNAGEPELYQFISYQFLHAHLAHIAGNMLFLWVFGNPVNARMGHVPYVLLYLATGVMAAAGYSLGTDAYMVGASGSIAGVTTAYLALFPRSHITFLIIFIFITTWELPAMLIILAKIILWDNILAPRFMGGGMMGNVAYEAHLAGYAFGFAATVLLMVIRALPRSQFDILALWRRWWQRQSFRGAMGDDAAAQARAQYGRVANVAPPQPPAAIPADPKQQRVAELRQQIAQAISQRDAPAAIEAYQQILEIDPQHVLARETQFELANYLLSDNRHHQAAQAYERLLAAFPRSRDVDQVRLLLGVVYARYLEQYDLAERHLSECLPRLTDERQRSQCEEWLAVIAEKKGGTGG
jgi:membrane associated rhomboid family serine protease